MQRGSRSDTGACAGISTAPPMATKAMKSFAGGELFKECPRQEIESLHGISHVKFNSHNELPKNESLRIHR